MAKILIVDDEHDQAASVAKVLATFGHVVITVPNGRDALVQVLNNPPDVIVLDMIMPEMDGPSFLEVVRSYLRLHTLPVVVFTGAADSPMLERMRAAKVNSVLV